MKYIYSAYSPIVAVVLLVFLSCKAGNSEAYQDYAMEESAADSITLQEYFQTDSLSDNNLRAFENRAVQKLYDVMDLIQILSDPQNDNAFRNQAKSMLLESFESSETEISLILPDTKQFKLTIPQFADSLLNNRFLPLRLRLIKSHIHQALVSTTENRYQGTIFFQLEPTANHKTLYPKEMNVEIILKKVNKDFGGTAKEVWEVFLGDLKD